MTDQTLSGTWEIAEYLEVSPKTVRRYVNERGLPATLIGGSYHTTTSLVDKWLKAQAEEDTRRRVESRNRAKDGGDLAVKGDEEGMGEV